MEFETLLFEQDGPLAIVTLNRPQVGNSLDASMTRELHEAMLHCDESKDVRGVLLNGAGKVFCVGGDLNHFAEHIANLPYHIKDLVPYLNSALTRMTRMNKPVIAAVQGNAAGIGVSFAAAADLALAGESSTFTLSYTNIGLSPDGSSTYHLPRLIGLRRALDLALTNRRLSAVEALEWGLVSRVVPDESLQLEARQLAMQLANGPTQSLGAAKRLLRESLNNSLETQLELEGQSIARMAATEDFGEGVMAFLQKRPPAFKGK